MTSAKGKHLLICGNDEFTVKQRALVLETELRPDNEMNLERIEGQVDTVDQALDTIARTQESLLTLPFFGGTKVVHLRHANFLADTPVGRSEAVIEALLALIKTASSLPPHEVRLILSSLNTDKRRRPFKAMEKNPAWLVEIHDVPDIHSRSFNLEAWKSSVQKLMATMSLEADQGVLERLFELVGADRRALHQELEKLRLYCHPHHRVTESDVRAICTQNRETIAWDMFDEIIAGRASKALALLRQLLAQGESDVGLCILLAQQIHLAAVTTHLYETKRLKLGDRNLVIDPSAHPLLPKNKAGQLPHPYRLKNILMTAKRRPASSWFRALDLLFDLSTQLVSASTDRTRLLEAGLVKLCAL